MLEDSVAKHMRADVTVGAFLSGGIDSTAIAALAMRHNPRLITFTTGFEREGFSEVDVAVASAEAIGARHVTKVVNQAEFVAALPEIVWYLDEPVADPALVPLFFIAREARKHVKVVLSGEGADELFGGYTIYREPLSLKPFDYLPRPVRRSMAKASEPLPEGMRGKSLLHRGSLRRSRSATTATRAASPTRSCGRCCRASARSGRTPMSPRRCTPSPTAGIRSRACSTSTCSPGCAATSWSRPTR